jgi:hypothetical protein
MLEFVDASLFLGMNCTDESLRIACKNFFVDRFYGTLAMSDDQAGYCDRIIWTYSRTLQDIYYPFMDRLRTDMTIQSMEYIEADIEAAQNLNERSDLKLSQKLTLGMAIARGGTLYTIDSAIYRVRTAALDLQRHVDSPSSGIEQPFPDAIIETCYQDSLVLKIGLSA